MEKILSLLKNYVLWGASFYGGDMATQYLKPPVENKPQSCIFCGNKKYLSPLNQHTEAVSACHHCISKLHAQPAPPKIEPHQNSGTAIYH